MTLFGANAVFADRRDAGRRLAEHLTHLKSQSPVVLGLPRGGVVVADEVARALDAPLDVLVVRKIGAPHQPELALGAVTDGGNRQRILNDDVLAMIRVPDDYLQAETDRQFAEVERRQALYRGGRAPIEVTDRTVIVVDDGIATGATVRAGIRSLRANKAASIVLAVPVAPPDTAVSLEKEVDALVCLESPRSFRAVGLYYGNFSQTTDAEVVEILEAASSRDD